MASLIDRELSRPLWRSGRTQTVILAAVTVGIYYYALFDVPRADQLIYLYRSADIHGFWDLVVRAYDFNRAHSAGDFMLFRPLLYMLLGLEHWQWGYDFAAWQATSVGLHMATTLSLYFYFRFVCRIAGDANSMAPFLSALFFAVNFAGTEQVAWHHIVGYLLFCLLTVQAFFAYQRLVEGRDPFNAGLVVVFAALAAFSYELGNVLNVLLGMALIACVWFERWKARTGRESAKAHGPIVAAALCLFFVPIFYAVWSYSNYLATVGPMVYRPTPASLFRVIHDVFEAVLVWLGSIAVPSALRLVPGSRITFKGPLPVLNMLSLVVMLIALTGTACAVMLYIRRRKAIDFVRNAMPGFVACALAAAYALIIVIGRGLERGIDNVLLGNSYYAYIFALLMVIALFHLALMPALSAEGKLALHLRRTVYCAMLAISVVSCWQVYRLHRAQYHTYSRPIGTLIDRIESVRAVHRGNDFSFSLAPDCGSMYLIPWFASHATKIKSRYTIATALFPDEEKAENGKYIISCPP